MKPITLNLDKVAQALEKAAKDAIVEKIPVEGDDRLVVKADQVHKLLETLKNDKNLQFNFLTDLTAVDYMGYPGREGERFEVVYQLYSQANNYRVRLKAEVPEADPKIRSIADLWANADWLEREVWDMYGILFEGHPDLEKHGKIQRLLMYEGFEGHPLRKDYPLKKHQPTIELRTPIETEPDPPYQWTKTEKIEQYGLTDGLDD